MPSNPAWTSLRNVAKSSRFSQEAESFSHDLPRGLIHAGLDLFSEPFQFRRQRNVHRGPPGLGVILVPRVTKNVELCYMLQRHTDKCSRRKSPSTERFISWSGDFDEAFVDAPMGQLGDIDAVELKKLEDRQRAGRLLPSQ